MAGKLPRSGLERSGLRPRTLSRVVNWRPCVGGWNPPLQSERYARSARPPLRLKFHRVYSAGNFLQVPVTKARPALMSNRLTGLHPPGKVNSKQKENIAVSA